MFHTYKQHDIFEVNLPYGQSGFMVNPALWSIRVPPS